ncbi:Phosphoglycolate phosphatase [Ferriphaselus amnicola]|uniref:Phosphoglycolate phosphatase n=1 Tax=Ferriphaselus amnicola TaxID=1188319 RepID=A0A2Z6GDN2_9PROT|nr:pyrimidine 5'-nucleotidase [Ferriphaselus amnicola]BBE51733.1 Phosphoglycolate phosphatase [Ferriphaselus amnicola]
MCGERVWIFDLDNTLHNATPHIFPHINRSMTAYLQRHLGLDEAGADALRMDYWRRYGATLTGLMRHHGTDPHHFLWHTHQFPNLPNMVLREARLRHVLKRLPGRKIVFSNGPQRYARAVLELMRVADLFDDVLGIEQSDFRPKPELAGFRAVLRKHRLNPVRCVMVEDSLENLQTAKRLGMKTVWVNAGQRMPAAVDVKIKDVLVLPKNLARLR